MQQTFSAPGMSGQSDGSHYGDMTNRYEGTSFARGRMFLLRGLSLGTWGGKGVGMMMEIVEFGYLLVS